MRIALAGNPNSGKTTMYNALTGKNEKVGNWAGVTVEKKEAKIKKNYYNGTVKNPTPREAQKLRISFWWYSKARR